MGIFRASAFFLMGVILLSSAAHVSAQNWRSCWQTTVSGCVPWGFWYCYYYTYDVIYVYSATSLELYNSVYRGIYVLGNCGPGLDIYLYHGSGLQAANSGYAWHGIYVQTTCQNCFFLLQNSYISVYYWGEYV